MGNAVIWIVLGGILAFGGYKIWQGWSSRDDANRADGLYRIGFGALAIWAAVGVGAGIIGEYSGHLKLTGTAVMSAFVWLPLTAICGMFLAGMVIELYDSRDAWRREQALHPDNRLRWWLPKRAVITLWVAVLVFLIIAVAIVGAVVSLYLESSTGINRSEDAELIGTVIPIAALAYGAIGWFYIGCVRERRMHAERRDVDCE